MRQPNTSFANDPVVYDQMMQAADYVAWYRRDQFIRELPRKMPGEQYIESPLEAIFLVWWNAIANARGASMFRLHPQEQVSIGDVNLRLDFAIHLDPHRDMSMVETLVASGLTWTPYAVEVDGHAFHERTREQVAERNQRDRLLQRAGWKVFHFSWEELTTDPVAHVGEVINAAWIQHNELLAKIWKIREATNPA
jgi:hypothetical protein